MAERGEIEFGQWDVAPEGRHIPETDVDEGQFGVPAFYGDRPMEEIELFHSQPLYTIPRALQGVAACPGLVTLNRIGKNKPRLIFFSIPPCGCVGAEI